MEPPADALHIFRRSFYECFHRRGDALFELADAILTADGGAPSPAHLSLQASHRRGWGSLYAALWRGRIDDEALRKLLSRHPLAGAEGKTPVYAVDVSVWDRCDAETSPERRYDRGRLTPVRVHRVVSSLLVELGVRQRRRRNLAVGRLGGPKVASLGERNATRPSRRLPEAVKRADARILRWT